MWLTEFQTLEELNEYFTDEQICIDYLENLRWGNQVKSPFIKPGQLSKIYKCKGNRYKCSKTNKRFNVRTGSIFQDSKIPLQKWIMAIFYQCVWKPKNCNSYELSRILNVSQTKTWVIMYKIKQAIKNETLWIKAKHVVYPNNYKLAD